MTVAEILQKRANIIAQARQILDAAEKENRGLTAEEEVNWRKAMDEAEALRRQAEALKRQEEIEAELRRSQGLVAAGKDGQSAGARDGQEAEARAAFARYLRGGFQALGEAELRVLQVGQNDQGGYVVPAQEVVRQFIQAVDDAVVIRPRATRLTVMSAQSVGVPSLDADPSDPEWTAELLTGAEDTAMRFGKRELRPHPLAKRIKVSNQLLRQATIDVEALIRQRFAYKFGVAEEKAFLTGDGVNKPLGLFVASDMGIPTSRDVDVSTGASATDITFDGLIQAKYALKVQYWARAAWLFHRDVVAKVAQLKDNNGQYLWRESVRVGEPDRLLGLPVLISEFAPNTFAANAYIGLLGDFSFYWIVDALDMQVQRLVELYAEQNQVGFIFRRELDGMPVLAEAFVRLKLA